MEILILIFAMVIVGLFIGWLAGLIWTEQRPMGASGDYLAAILSTVIVGMIDWYVIPAMGFSDSLRNLGVAIEPPVVALIVLWLIRRAKK